VKDRRNRERRIHERTRTVHQGGHVATKVSGPNISISPEGEILKGLGHFSQGRF
jgi:hypothetical protein